MTNIAIAGLLCSAFRATSSAAKSRGTEEEIEQFCQLNYGVTFPLFAKVDVNGDNAHPLFQYLKEEAPGVIGNKGDQMEFHEVFGRPQRQGCSSFRTANKAKRAEKGN